MHRYRANVPFGPWVRGDVFESSDPMHAKMAVEGKYLTVADEASPVPQGEEEGQDGQP